MSLLNEHAFGFHYGVGFLRQPKLQVKLFDMHFSKQDVDGFLFQTDLRLRREDVSA